MTTKAETDASVERADPDDSPNHYEKDHSYLLIAIYHNLRRMEEALEKTNHLLERLVTPTCFATLDKAMNTPYRRNDSIREEGES